MLLRIVGVLKKDISFDGHSIQAHVADGKIFVVKNTTFLGRHLILSH
jgi:hypothetical protein